MAMLYTVMKYLNNFFIKDIERGDFNIVNGIITAKNKYLVGQYILIRGSVLNDGIYLVSDSLITLSGARDESFTGAICGLAVPDDFIDLCRDIEEFNKKLAKNPNIGIVQSESFGGYAYSLATNSDGSTITWQSAHQTRLNMYKRMFPPRIL